MPHDSSRPGIIERVAAGDPAAVDECIRAYGPLVWSMARRWLRDDVAAEDVVQEVFIQVWKSAERFDPRRAAESTWIAAIAPWVRPGYIANAMLAEEKYSPIAVCSV